MITITRLITIPLLVIISSAYSAVQVTDLYAVGQGNVALTTQQTTRETTVIKNQYTYSPYGIQNDLEHPKASQMKVNKQNNSDYQKLANQERKPVNIKNNQFGYTGQSNDPSTTLMMLGGFRNYAPGIGRFIQPDTYNSFSKHTINNPDAYVQGNPLFFTDPSGHVFTSFMAQAWDILNPLEPFEAAVTAAQGGAVSRAIANAAVGIAQDMLPGTRIFSGTEVLARGKAFSHLFEQAGMGSLTTQAERLAVGAVSRRLGPDAGLNISSYLVKPVFDRAAFDRGEILVRDLWKYDLRGANLSEADLSGADLRGANLRWADLSEADLRGANLSGANLNEADLSFADLSGADLRWANLSGANLSEADLSEAYLCWANLSRANLGDASLFYAKLRGANLSGAYLSGANLNEADLSFADLSGANLRWANLSRANLSEADLSGADLRGANLSEARLFYANLSRANLSEADLRGADLRGANLSEASLFYANLSRANLSGALVEGAKFHEVVC